MIRRSSALVAVCLMLIAGGDLAKEGHAAAGWALIALAALIVWRVVRNACRRGVII